MVNPVRSSGVFLLTFALCTTLAAPGEAQGHSESSLEGTAGQFLLNPDGGAQKKGSSNPSPVEAYYAQAIRSSPRKKDLHFQLGLELWNEHKVAEANSQFLEELRIDPDCHRAQVMLGMTKLEEGKDEDAVHYLEAALEADSTLHQAFLPLGKAWFRLGNLQKAQKALENAVRAEPGLPPAYALLAQVYSKLGRPTDAANMSELDAKARDLKTAESFAAAGNWEKALQSDSTFLGAFPDSSRGLYIKGLILFNGYRKIDEATAALKKSLLQDPANIEARRLLGIMDWVAGNKPAFEAEMTLVLAADPLDALAHYYWGRYAFEAGRFEEARENMEFAERFRPDDERVATNLALAYEALGLPQEAEKQHVAALTLAAQHDSPDPWPFLNYGAFLLNTNRPAEAVPVLRKAMALPKVHPKAYYLTGVAYARTGQPVEAAACLERAVAADPRWPEPRAALVAIYDQLGKKQEAGAQRAILAKLSQSPQEQPAR
jgi:Tfp pilus assembly protein PilF